ncbi:hypothetical protein K438DRAFT_1957186 [Mycena galopus ATCC 62051]|nr:hypothetical protein K438DRAFT_1957186 [Mycena galopus ATCC 62051]
MWCKFAVLPLLACLAGAAAGFPMALNRSEMMARTSTLSPVHQAAIKDVYGQLMQIKQEISNGETNISIATAATSSGADPISAAAEKRETPAEIALESAAALLFALF